MEVWALWDLPEASRFSKAGDAAVPRLYVGIVYGAQNLFTTEGTEDHGGGLGLPLMTLIFGKQVICAGLQSTRVIGQIIWAGFTAHKR
jgi:hypothetical protein